jgi:hypothetical protein
MSDRIDHSNDTVREIDAHPSSLVAEALHLPVTTIQIKHDYPTCHSTPHKGDVLPGNIQLGGNGGEGGKGGDANATAKASANADANASSDSTSNSSAKVGDVQGGNSTINNNINGSDMSKMVPSMTVIPASPADTGGGAGYTIVKDGQQLSASDHVTGQSRATGVGLSLPGFGISFSHTQSEPTADSVKRVQVTHDLGVNYTAGVASKLIFDDKSMRAQAARNVNKILQSQQEQSE